MSDRFDNCGWAEPNTAASQRERGRQPAGPGSSLIRGRLAAVLTLFGALLCPRILRSQAAPDQDLTSLRIEDLARVKVFSASRHLEESRQAPAAVSIITAEQIRRYGWRTLADILNSVRGFYTAYDRNYTYLGVRGFMRPGDYNSRILLLINGHRVNENVYDSALLGTEFPLDLDLIERIEIVRGPSSSLFGTNAVFGVINVITRRPTPEAMVEASADTSSFFGRTGRLASSFRRGRLSALVSGSLYRSAGQSQLFFPEFASPATNKGIAADIDGDRYAHTFTDLQYGNFRIQGLYSSRMKIIPTASYETNFNDPGTHTTDTRGYFDVGYHRSISSRTDLDLRGYYDAYRYSGTYAYGGTNSPSRYLNLDLGTADWAGVEGTLGHQFGKHRITVGTDYEYSFRVDQRNYNAGEPPIVDDHRTPSWGAAFGEAELNLLPQLSFRAGARLDWFDTFGGQLSPRIALIYSPNSRTSVKYIFGRAFRAPNAYESYYTDNVSIVAPTRPLQPENIQSHEVVIERNVTPWLGMTAGAFRDNMQNLIDQVPDPATGFTHFVNVGRDHSQGIEFELTSKWASGFSARASYTLTEAKEYVAQQRQDNFARHTAKLHAALPLSQRAFAGFELLYSSAQESNQETRIPPWFLGNITLSTRPLWGSWEFSTSCYNVFDRRWYTPAPPGLRQAEIQQDGRTIRFKITYRWHGEQKQ